MNGYEILLENLAGNQSPEWKYFQLRKEAYDRLKELTGQDFGFSVARWKTWLVANGHIPHDKSPLNPNQWNNAHDEPLERVLLNLEVEADPDDIFLYMSKHDAVEKLMQITGQDLGNHAHQWRQWLQNNYCPPHGGGSWVHER